MAIQPTLGPISQRKEIAAFSAVSTVSFRRFRAAVGRNPHPAMENFAPVFLKMIDHAEQTSVAIRSISSCGFLAPALALFRVRVEQVITASYLVHEDFRIGLEPFVLHVPIKMHMDLQDALNQPVLGDWVRGTIGSASLVDEARIARAMIQKREVSDSDKFSREWTRLSLHDLARRRDELTMPKPAPIFQGLLRDYVGIYKTLSSIVHADCSSLSTVESGLAYSTSDPTSSEPISFWHAIIATNLARYDLLQCHESLTKLSTGADLEMEPSFEEFVKAGEEFWPKVKTVVL